jgi:hypothetical protein
MQVEKEVELSMHGRSKTNAFGRRVPKHFRELQHDLIHYSKANFMNRFTLVLRQWRIECHKIALVLKLVSRQQRSGVVVHHSGTHRMLEL